MRGDGGRCKQGGAKQGDAEQGICQPLYGRLFAHADDECANPVEAVFTYMIDGDSAGQGALGGGHLAILVQRGASIVEHRDGGDIPVSNGLRYKQPDPVVPAFRHRFAHQQGLPGNQGVELGLEAAEGFPISDRAVDGNQDCENHQDDRHKAREVARTDRCQANAFQGTVLMGGRITHSGLPPGSA